MQTLTKHYINNEINSTGLEKKWEQIVEKIDFAFQPIVNIHTGSCFGFEALLRNYKAAGYYSIKDIINDAYRDNMALFVDMLMREKAIEKFVGIKFHESCKLFYNIDNRTLLMPNRYWDRFYDILKKNEFNKSAFCLEISEKHDFDTYILQDGSNLEKIMSNLNEYKRGFFKLAIDDFGTGLSGLELLYHSEPNYIKIDRFFINEIENDSKKKIFVTSILNIAHKLGISVIAEGVETEKEFYFCRQIGCDFVQGYMIQRPLTDINQLKIKYQIVSDLNKQDNRNRDNDLESIRNEMEYLEPIPIQRKDQTIIEMTTIFEMFRKNKQQIFFPIINGNGEPIGVIREKDLKEYVYSPYGKDLLKNETAGDLSEFISKMPVSDIKVKIEKILEVFSFEAESEGLLLTNNGQYEGFLSASSLLKLLHEKNVLEARDQNPLTNLPGNAHIQKYILQSVEDSKLENVFVYFDFDNFKPFNDVYGFRQGDRAILIFADILREYTNRQRCFIGHIGGDDFFMGFRNQGIVLEEICQDMKTIIELFSNSVTSMYSAEDQERGYIYTLSRHGRNKKYPLLRVSAGVLIIPAGQEIINTEIVFLELAKMKKKAKEKSEKFCTGIWEKPLI